MNSTQKDVAFGKQFERTIAQVYIDKVYKDAFLVEMPTYSDIDFAVICKGKIIAFIETKTRKIASTLYDSTMLSERKHIAAKDIKNSLKVPVIALIAFTDVVASFSLVDVPDEVKFVGRRDRGMRGTEHAFYLHSRMVMHPDLVVELPKG